MNNFDFKVGDEVEAKENRRPFKANFTGVIVDIVGSTHVRLKLTKQGPMPGYHAGQILNLPMDRFNWSYANLIPALEEEPAVVAPPSESSTMAPPSESSAMAAPTEKTEPNSNNEQEGGKRKRRHKTKAKKSKKSRKSRSRK